MKNTLVLIDLFVLLFIGSSNALCKPQTYIALEPPFAYGLIKVRAKIQTPNEDKGECGNDWIYKDRILEYKSIDQDDQYNFIDFDFLSSNRDIVRLWSNDSDVRYAIEDKLDHGL
jgi:hypothetical protein